MRDHRTSNLGVALLRYALAALLGGLWHTSSAVDLLWVYHEAQQADSVYAAARATKVMVQEKRPQALATLLPAVTLSGYVFQNRRDLQFRDGTPSTNEHYNSRNTTLSATQPLFRYQNWAGYNQAGHQVSQAEAILLQAEQDLIVRVAQTYFDVLIAENNVVLATAQKTAFSEQYAQARRNFQVGTATLIDSREAQARFDVAVYQEAAAINDLEARKEALSQIIGRPPPALAKISFPFTPTLPEPASLQDWLTQARRTSIQLRIAQESVEIATQDISKSRAGRLPTVDAVAAYSSSGYGSGIEGGTGIDSKTRFIGLQFAMPLYLGGLTNSRVRESIAGLDKAIYELETARRSVLGSTRVSFLNVVNAVAQSHSLRTALVSNQLALDAITLGRESGLRTQVDVLNAQQQVITTRRDYVQAIYAYAVNVLRLKAAAGVLTEEDVGYVNQWLTK